VTAKAVREISDKELLRPAQRLIQLAGEYLSDDGRVTPIR